MKKKPNTPRNAYQCALLLCVKMKREQFGASAPISHASLNAYRTAIIRRFGARGRLAYHKITIAALRRSGLV